MTRQLPCDTLRYPGKRTNDVQTAREEPSDFLKEKAAVFATAAHFLGLIQICQAVLLAEICGNVTAEGIQ